MYSLLTEARFLNAKYGDERSHVVVGEGKNGEYKEKIIFSGKKGFPWSGERI